MTKEEFHIHTRLDTIEEQTWHTRVMVWIMSFLFVVFAMNSCEDHKKTHEQLKSLNDSIQRLNQVENKILLRVSEEEK